MQEAIQPDNRDVPNVRLAGAFLLDFITAFFAFSYIVTLATGDVYAMSGRMALVSVAMTISYFIIGRYAGGTLWQRVCRMK